VTSTFLRRTSNIYHGEKRRAKAAGVQIAYTLEQLRDTIQAALGEPCTYCGEIIKPSNVSVDHRTPNLPYWSTHFGEYPYLLRGLQSTQGAAHRGGVHGNISPHSELAAAGAAIGAEPASRWRKTHPPELAIQMEVARKLMTRTRFRTLWRMRRSPEAPGSISLCAPPCTRRPLYGSICDAGHDN